MYITGLVVRKIKELGQKGLRKVCIDITGLGSGIYDHLKDSLENDDDQEVKFDEEGGDTFRKRFWLLWGSSIVFFLLGALCAVIHKSYHRKIEGGGLVLRRRVGVRLKVYAVRALPGDKAQRRLVLHQVLATATAFSLDPRPLHPGSLHIDERAGFRLAISRARALRSLITLTQPARAASPLDGDPPRLIQRQHGSPVSIF